MRLFFSVLMALLVIQFSWSQKRVPQQFGYTDAKLEQVLADVEQKFQIKYSYVDSLVTPKIITLPSKKYTLEELHAAIEFQTALTIVAIDQRYFSIYKETSTPLKEEQLKEILVEGFLTKGINKVDQKIVLLPQKIELPGVTDADILLSLQQLPGVKSPNETASGLHVRGGTSDQNLIMWDGIRMYHPGHLFGMISGFNPNVEQTVSYYNKATDPQFGERISSVIAINTTDKIPDNTKVTAGINALNGDGYVQIPLVKNKLGLQLSGRKSFTEWWQSPTFDALAAKVFQNTNFKNFNDKNRFEFEDYSAKLNYKLSANTDFSITSILIDNYLNFNTDAGDSQTVGQKMNIKNQGYSFHWNQRYSSKFSQNTLLYYSGYTFDYEKKQETGTSDFEQFNKVNRITDSGMEWNFKYQAPQHFDVAFGYQLLGNDISHSFTSKNQNFEIDLDQKHLNTTTHVGYLDFKYTLNNWNFQAGARYNSFTMLKATSFEPRIFIQRNLTKAFIGQLSYERKSQILSQVRESVTNDLSLENYVWILSDNAQYPIQKANQFTAGGIYKKKSWLLDMEVYYKTIDGITSRSFGFVNQYDSYLHQGNGFTKGIDVLIQKSAPTWRAWLTYTYQDSQNRYKDLNAHDYFPINSESQHALTVSFHKKWNNYSMALGWFWHTGKPYSLLDDSNQIVSYNSERLPVYHRLDLSGAYQFHAEKSWLGKVGFSVFNAYNQHSILSKEYERQYTTINDIVQSNYKIQEYYSLGITPNIFLRISF